MYGFAVVGSEVISGSRTSGAKFIDHGGNLDGLSVPASQLRAGELGDVVLKQAEHALEGGPGPVCGRRRPASLLDGPHCRPRSAQLFNEKLREWENYYNYDRPHGALAGQTPYERLLARTRAAVLPKA
jgi:hypothetical protein